RELGKRAEAEAAYRAALKEFQRLADDHPAVPDYRNELAGTLVDLANLQRNRKDFAQARQLLEQALPHNQAALAANPDHTTYRQCYSNNLATLASILLDLGDYDAAEKTADRLVKVAIGPGNDLYNASSLLARCAPLAEKDDKLPEAKRK